jgi:hypothetical protein
MNDEQLIRSIKSIGKECFEKYYEYFLDQSKSNANIIEFLMRTEGNTEAGSSISVSYARRIIRSGRAQDILFTISNSIRLTNDVKDKAKEHLQKYFL